MDEIDFSQDAKPEDSGVTNVSVLQQTVDGLRRAKQMVAFYEGKVASAKQEVLRYQHDTLVGVMDSLGTATSTTLAGDIVSVKPHVSASIPSKTKIEEADDDEKARLIERRDAAIAWLYDNGLGSIVATNIIIDVGKSDNLRQMVLAFLNEHGIKASEEQRVHPATLVKGLREVMAKGVEVPVEPFNLFVGRNATVKFNSSKGK